MVLVIQKIQDQLMLLLFGQMVMETNQVSKRWKSPQDQA